MELDILSKIAILLMVIWAKIAVPMPSNLPGERIYDLVYAPGHQLVAYTRLNSTGQPTLYVADVDRSNEKAIFTSPYETIGTGIADIVWSPNGQQLAFTLSYFDPDQSGFAVSEIMTIYVDGSGLFTLVPKAHWVFAPIWLVDGKHLAFSFGMGGCNAIYIIDINGKNRSYLIGCLPIG